MLANNSLSSSLPCNSEPFSCLENGNSINKRKRRPAGTPDPDAEVVSLSPKTLLESDRYVCEICNQGFQRDQNLQMHRRRHKVPWKLLKRETPVLRKRVFVCPEPSCLHHDPCHALGDLVGIKKHFRRKHSNHKQWVCEKCSKGYAVQSDYKAHLKTCGTRGHSCDCGRVFSRVESFIEHQDACNLGNLRSESQSLQPAACLSRTASSPSPSSDTNFSTAPWLPLLIPRTTPDHAMFFITPTTTSSVVDKSDSSKSAAHYHNLELQLSTASGNPLEISVSPKREDTHSTQLQLSIGSSDVSDRNESNISYTDKDHGKSSPRENNNGSPRPELGASRLKEQVIREQLMMAMAEKIHAEEARQQAKRQIELAEQEFANAKRIRQQAQAELDKAQALKQHAIKQINSTILQITCHACKQKFHARTQADENSLVMSYMSSATTEDEVEHINGIEFCNRARMCLHVETAENIPMGDEANGSKALESPPVKLALEVDAKKSKKRKRRTHCSTMVANDCHITKLEKSYTRVMLSLTKPSYLLGLGSNFIRHENRMRLFHLLQKLVRQHNWTEAAGVLSVFLRATCKDKSPILNRFKYTVSLDLLKHIEGDDVSLSAISSIYDTWMARIGTNLSNTRNKDGQMKEDSFVVRLQFILSRVMQGDIEAERHNVKILMEERGYENHPFFNMILGLISSQLWYSSLPEEMQWKDTFQIHSPTHSDMPATPSQLEMSAMRFSHEVGDSERHNAICNEESGASFHCDSETSVMKDKEISVEVDGSFNREALPVEVAKLHKENLQKDFQPQGFYVNSAESDASFDNNGGHMHFVPNPTAFENSGSWLLPLRTGNWDLDQIVRDEEYRNAVKYLQEAVHSTPPVPAALLPLVQLLLIGCKDKEALDEIEKFCANSSGALPKRMKANILEHVDPNNSVVLATCYEDTLKSDPKCSQSLARLISLHQKGDYSPQSLLEMIALHLDAVFVEYDTWREFALCFFKVSLSEEDEMSVCQHGNEGEKRQSYSVCYNGIPKMFTQGKSVGLWRSRCRWWSTRHFSKSILASEIDAGDWQLLTYKAACASHMYGQDFGYVAKAYTCIQKENNRDLSMFLRQHMQNSLGLYSQLQRGNN